MVRSTDKPEAKASLPRFLLMTKRTLWSGVLGFILEESLVVLFQTQLHSFGKTVAVGGS